MRKLANDAKNRSDLSIKEQNDVFKSIQQEIKNLENSQAKAKRELKTKETRKVAKISPPSVPPERKSPKTKTQPTSPSKPTSRSSGLSASSSRSSSAKGRSFSSSSSNSYSNSPSENNYDQTNYQELSPKSFLLTFENSKKINVPDYLGEDGKKKELTVVVQENGFHQVWEVQRNDDGEITQYILISEFNSSDPRIGELLFKVDQGEKTAEETVSRKPASKRQSFKVEDLNNL